MIRATTIHHFEVFCEVARCRNMSRASESLFLAQSSVSKIISELEDYYHTRLFERFPKKLILTASGEELYRYAENLLAVYDETNIHMKDFGDTNLLRIGVSATVGSFYMAPLVSEFKSQNSSVNPAVFVYSTQNIQKRLLNHELDIALCDIPIDSQGLVRFPIMEDKLILVCGPKHPLACRTSLIPSDLDNCAFIFRENFSGTRRILDRYLKRYNINAQTAWISNNVESVKKAAMENLGIAMVPRVAVTEELASKSLVALPLYDDSFSRFFSIVYPKNKYLSTAIKSFIEVCGLKMERE